LHAGDDCKGDGNGSRSGAVGRGLRARVVLHGCDDEVGLKARDTPPTGGREEAQAGRVSKNRSIQAGLNKSRECLARRDIRVLSLGRGTGGLIIGLTGEIPQRVDASGSGLRLAGAQTACLPDVVARSSIRRFCQHCPHIRNVSREESIGCVQSQHASGKLCRRWVWL